MKTILKIILLTGICVVIESCSTNTESDGSELEIIKISVSENDSLTSGAGIFIQFSDVIDLASFQADSVHTQYQVFAPGMPPVISDLDVYKIENSLSVILNGVPQTFYYDPATASIALIEETTLQMPEGTGEGFYLNPGQNTLILKSTLQSQDGKMLNNDQLWSLFKSDLPYRFKAVPNPLYQPTSGDDPRILFINLPVQSEINIFNHNGLLINTLYHDGEGTEIWNLKDTGNRQIDSGVYLFEIENSNISYQSGVFVVN